MAEQGLQSKNEQGTSKNLDPCNLQIVILGKLIFESQFLHLQ